MSKRKTIGWIIRFHYEKEDPRFEWRLNYFIKEVLPRIQNQTVQGFDICIRCNKWHKKIFEDLGLKTFTVKNEYVAYKDSKDKRHKYFYDFITWDKVIGLKKYDIQIGLDSDDLIENNYLEKALEVIDKNESKKESIHICFQPKFIFINNNKRQRPPRYSTRNGSAFMVLYQPNKKNYRFIYEESHTTIIRKADKKFVLPIGYCYATCHEYNESTGK